MDERKRRLQAEVRRQNQKKLTTQRITWTIIAICMAAAAVTGLFHLQDAMDAPERHAKKYIGSVKAREAYQAPGYMENIHGMSSQGNFPSFYGVEVLETQVEEKMGPEDDEPVQVVIIMSGEEVAGTSAAKAKREAGNVGQPTHDIRQRWQKLRDGELHYRGKWKVLETQIRPLQ